MLRPVSAQDRKLEKFFLSNSTLSESRAPLYIAQDLKLFEKYGLDAQIVNIRGSAINNASLMAGEIQMAVANGTIAITAAARGAPIVIVATIGPTRYSLVSRSLNAVAQLKGKVIGIGGFGIGDYNVLRRLVAETRPVRERGNFVADRHHVLVRKDQHDAFRQSGCRAGDPEQHRPD